MLRSVIIWFEAIPYSILIITLTVSVNLISYWVTKEAGRQNNEIYSKMNRDSSFNTLRGNKQ